jgi:hypothetical protein
MTQDSIRARVLSLTAGVAAAIAKQGRHPAGSNKGGQFAPGGGGKGAGSKAGGSSDKRGFATKGGVALSFRDAASHIGAAKEAAKAGKLADMKAAFSASEAKLFAGRKEMKGTSDPATKALLGELNRTYNDASKAIGKEIDAFVAARHKAKGK